MEFALLLELVVVLIIYYLFLPRVKLIKRGNVDRPEIYILNEDVLQDSFAERLELQLIELQCILFWMDEAGL